MPIAYRLSRIPTPRSARYLAVILTVLLLAACSQPSAGQVAKSPLQGAGSSLGPAPLVPTALPDLPTPTPLPAALPVADPVQPAPPLPEPGSLRWRAGVGVPDGKSPLPYAWPDPRPGWYLNWSAGFTETAWLSHTLDSGLDFVIPPDTEAGMEFSPMVRVAQGELAPPADWIAAVARALPGRTWLIGNEPDVRWQDNATPEQYAAAYHAAYTTIKEADPSASVAIAGLSQITPLRLAYLDQVWAAYQKLYGVPMPVDVWTMHAFILQEKAGDWGVDLPPGMDDEQSGELWTIEEHDSLPLVEEQVRRMRAWMADHGQQDKPLWITEYGILMPAGYGFDEERVRRFLLHSFDLFNSLADPALGLPADDDRLVQRWVWFSAGYEAYPTGNLFTPDGQPTGVMDALAAYLENFAGPFPECDCTQR